MHSPRPTPGFVDCIAAELNRGFVRSTWPLFSRKKAFKGIGHANDVIKNQWASVDGHWVDATEWEYVNSGKKTKTSLIQL